MIEEVGNHAVTLLAPPFPPYSTRRTSLDVLGRCLMARLLKTVKSERY